ncbi:MAG TPA: CPBP family intramembrane glutamic endopeptidase [Candidatus Acidoferrum sp.]|nr:CPBP family intramembrane glutamic endopeptidase [Candidatus Acidoferrum sp.]
MANERLTGSDKRTLLLWILLGVVGALFAHKYFFRAFPEASVDFKVSRSEALERARNFVSGLGENLSGYQSAIVFDVDDDAKTYLEREVGLQQANRLMSSQLNIWYWDARFFRPGQEEEFYVRVSPGGQIVGYQHKVPEAQAGATLERAAAQTDAENFLRSKMGVNLGEWDFLSEEANSSKKPNRMDWSFTWEKHGFKAKDAPYRLRVTLEGDRPGSSQEFLHVPETWQRSYEHLRSTNIFYNQIAILPYLLLMGSVIWLGILLTKRGQTSWGPAIKLGIVVAILLTFMQLNNWPLDRMGYDTNSAYSTFALGELAKALLFGIGSALTISLVLPGAEPLYRAMQPDRLRLTKALTLRGLRSKEFFNSATIGLSMAAAHIGFIVAFYIVASHFGAWAPQDVNYENSVNTMFPWISGVAIGMLAAASEEFLFRLFAIPFLKRLTGSTAIAVIVPAFCWSFLHSAYPNEPPYIRGLEVGLIGIVAGLVMLRWGILTTLVWHYTVDASLVGLLLVRSNSMYFKISGVIVGAAALAPLLFAGVSYLARGKFEADEDLRNAAEPPGEISFASEAAEAEGVPAARKYEALSPAAMIILAACLALGGVAVWKLKTPTLGDYLRLSVNAKEARARADEVMKQRGLDPNAYRHATILVDTTDPVTNEYLRRRIGVAGLNAIYAKEVPGELWSVRYFKDSQPEEYTVVLKPDGTLHAVHHILAENAAGASLTKDEAVALAEKFLRDEKKIDLSHWALVESNSEKHPHRTDHSLTWQEKAPLDGGDSSAASSTDYAYARIDLHILGDQPADFRTYIKIPDEWRRAQSEQTLSRTLYGAALPILLFCALGTAALIYFFKNMRSEAMRAVPWKRLLSWAAWALIGYAVIVGLGNRIQFFLSAYQTAIPFKTMMGGVTIAILLGALFYTGGVLLLYGVASYFSNRVFGEERLPIGASLPGEYYRDAFWIGICGAVGFLGFRHGMESLAALWPTLHRSFPAQFGQYFDAVLPSAAAFGSALIRSLYLTGLIAFLAAFVASVVQKRWLRLLLYLLGALALAGSDWGNGADFGKELLAGAILLAVIIIFVRRIIRFNVLGYLLIVACLVLTGAAAALLPQPNLFYRENGYVAIVLLLLLLGWPLTVWRLRTATKN